MFNASCRISTRLTTKPTSQTCCDCGGGNPHKLWGKHHSTENLQLGFEPRTSLLRGSVCSCDPASACCTEPFIHICSFVYFESAFQRDVSSTCSQTFTSFTALCRRVIPALKLGHTGIYTSERSLQRQFILLGLLRSGDQINSNKSSNLTHEFAPMTIRKHLHASAQRRQNKGS